MKVSKLFPKIFVVVTKFCVYSMVMMSTQSMAQATSNVTPSYMSPSLRELNALKAPFVLAPLPYPANSLEIAFDEKTMNIHHGKHHQAYVDNLNKNMTDTKLSLGEILMNISKHSAAVRNNGGGHWNHTFFWSVLSGKSEDQIVPKRLLKEIESQWKSLENFQAEFEKAGLGQFGSGWAWLIRTKNGLAITATPYQDNPLMDTATQRGWPILAADVWEHAYYLRYQNKRSDYLKGFWKVVNWKMVDRYNQEAMKLPAL